MKAKFTSAHDYKDRAVLQDVIPLETPFMICVDPCSYCNITCQYCVHYDIKHDKVAASRFGLQMMSLELAKKIVDDLSEFQSNIKELAWYGWGEPLLNPSIDKMVEYCRKSGKVDRTAIITNGIALTNDLSDKLIEAGLQRINFSIQGIDADGYLKVCDKRIDFDSFVSQIRYMYEHKDSNLVMYVKIGDSLLKKTEDKQRFIDIFSEICDEIMIEKIVNVRDDAISNINIEKADRGIFGQELKERNVCPMLFFRMFVCPDGTCVSCNADWYREQIIGDVSRESLRDIWHGNKMKQLQRQHLLGKRKDISLCGKCGNIVFIPNDDIDDYADVLLKRIEEKGD